MPRELERLLLRPISLLSLLLWAINDHYLKAAWSNAFTGKLSDVTSLIVAPMLLAYACAALHLGRAHVRSLLTFWCIALALVMIAIKLWEPAAEVYRVGLALLQWPWRCLLAGEWVQLAPVQLAMDASDVATIPAALIPLWLLDSRRRPDNSRSEVRGAAVFVPRGAFCTFGLSTATRPGGHRAQVTPLRAARSSVSALVALRRVHRPRLP